MQVVHSQRLPRDTLQIIPLIHCVLSQNIAWAASYEIMIVGSSLTEWPLDNWFYGWVTRKPGSKSLRSLPLELITPGTFITWKWKFLFQTTRWWWSMQIADIILLPLLQFYSLTMERMILRGLVLSGIQISGLFWRCHPELFVKKPCHQSYSITMLSEIQCKYVSANLLSLQMEMIRQKWHKTTKVCLHILKLQYKLMI